MRFATLWRYPWRPFRFKALGAAYAAAGARPRVLDVGCGNRSPATTKLWWPRCIYTGIDQSFDHYDDADRRALDASLCLDLEVPALAGLLDAQFDIIIASHVVEHLHNALPLLTTLAARLAPCGALYVETPAPRSLTLPSRPGTLNFHDDATHVRLYTLDEIRATLSHAGLRIVRAETRRDVAQIAALPLRYAQAKAQHRQLEGSALWDWTGFAHYVLARR